MMIVESNTHSSSGSDSDGSTGAAAAPPPPLVVNPSAIATSDVSKWKRRVDDAKSIGDAAVEVVAEIRSLYNLKIGSAPGRQSLLPEELWRDEMLVKRLDVCLDNYETARLVSFVPKLFACEQMLRDKEARNVAEFRAALSRVAVNVPELSVQMVQELIDEHRNRERVVEFARSILAEDRTCSSMGNAYSSGYLKLDDDFPLTAAKIRGVIERAFEQTVAGYATKIRHIVRECGVARIESFVPAEGDAGSNGQASSMPSKRRKLTGAERELILNRQDNMCAELGCQVTESECCFEADHIVPHCITGNNELTNMQLLCPNCHAMKTKREMRYLHVSGFFREKSIAV